MNPLDQLEMKYQAPPPQASTRHALTAVHRAIGHVQRGDHQAAIAELQKSPDAMAHPAVQAAMQQLRAPARRQSMPGQIMQGRSPQRPQMPQRQPPMPGMAEGGPVQGQSSPGTPGVLGAIHDAVSALKDYVIDRPKREQQAAREEYENAYINQGQPGYAEGGKVSQITSMAKFMADQLGLAPAKAKQLASQYHNAVPVSSTAQQMANDVVHNVKPPSQQVLKTPQQLAQELQSGFVDPQDLQHLMYVDPTLTPLITRYQSGIDNQDLTPQQKQALIQKLQSMGPAQAGPQLPQPGAPPPQAPQGPPPQGGPPPGAAGPPPGAMPQQPGAPPQQIPPGAQMMPGPPR